MWDNSKDTLKVTAVNLPVLGVSFVEAADNVIRVLQGMLLVATIAYTMFQTLKVRKDTNTASK
jgi:hypothetical protein